MSNVPDELRYTKSHEWVRKEDDGSVTIGISDHAQAALGDLVFVEAPEAGDSVNAGDAVAVVESVKAASDVYAPIAGEIVAGNDALADAPEAVNEDSYGEGWIFRMKPENMDDVDALMDAEAYKKVLEDE